MNTRFMRGALAACLIAIMGALLAFADGYDDRGNPNDPATNERANACFEGGSMARKCVEEWEWTCGWYIIRIDDNLMTVDDLPSYCNSLVDYAPVATGFPGCVNAGSGFINFGNSNILTAPYELFADDGCTDRVGIFVNPVALVYASSNDEAAILCEFADVNFVTDANLNMVWTCKNPDVGIPTFTPLPEF